MHSNLLITGASGFSGQHACTHFLKKGYNVTAVTKETPLTSDKFSSNYCNLINKDEVMNLIETCKPDFVLHLAGQNNVENSWNDPISFIEANTMSTANLLDALRIVNTKCKIVVIGSALQCEPNHLDTVLNPYSLSKTLQVFIAQSYRSLFDMDIIIAIPSNLIGPGWSNGVCSVFAKKIVMMENNLAEKNLEVNNLLAQRDFLDVRDAINAYEILIKYGQPGEMYNIASGNSYSLEDLIIELRSLTKIDFHLKIKVESKFEKQVNINCLKIQELGWSPKISFKKSITDVMEYYRRLS